MEQKLNIDGLNSPLVEKNSNNLEYVNQIVYQLFDDLIKDMQPSSDLLYGIILGLFVKCKKLYRSCNTLVDNDDTLAFLVILRSYYEATISLRYIVKHHDHDHDDIEKQFIVANTMSELRNLQSSKKEANISKTQYKTERDRLNQRLEPYGLNIKDIPRGYPKSWHPTKSFKMIAKDLDTTGEALEIYSSLYAATSRFVHPSFDDVLKWHVTKYDENAPYLPNETRMYIPMQERNNGGKILLMCITLSMHEAVSCSPYTKTDNYTKKECIEKIHNNFHKSFNDTRSQMAWQTEGMLRYADFWMQNYKYDKNNSTAG
jgi:hypothetical protein